MRTPGVVTLYTLVQRVRIVARITVRLLRGILKTGWPSWVLFGFLGLAAIGPTVAPYDPLLFDPGNALQGPSLFHPFGTDHFGRDLLSRMMVGSRTLVTISGVATLVALALGVAWGLLAAYLGGIHDEVLMRGVDILISIPVMLIAIMIMTVLGTSNRNLILGVACIYSPYISRVIRSGALAIMGQEYVDAARIAGESMAWIIFREVLPNLVHVVIVETAMRFGFVVLLVASLGFLGLGVQPPTPDWGLIVSDARGYVAAAPWLVVFPACGIGGLVVASHALADRIGEPKREAENH